MPLLRTRTCRRLPRSPHHLPSCFSPPPCCVLTQSMLPPCRHTSAADFDATYPPGDQVNLGNGPRASQCSAAQRSLAMVVPFGPTGGEQGGPLVVVHAEGKQGAEIERGEFLEEDEKTLEGLREVLAAVGC